MFAPNNKFNQAHKKHIFQLLQVRINSAKPASSDIAPNRY